MSVLFKKQKVKVGVIHSVRLGDKNKSSFLPNTAMSRKQNTKELGSFVPGSALSRFWGGSWPGGRSGRWDGGASGSHAGADLEVKPRPPTASHHLLSLQFLHLRCKVAHLTRDGAGEGGGSGAGC